MQAGHSQEVQLPIDLSGVVPVRLANAIFMDNDVRGQLLYARRIAYASPWALPAIASERPALGLRTVRFDDAFVGCRPDEPMRYFMHTDDACSATITDLGAFALKYPEASKAGLVFSSHVYHRMQQLTMDGSTSKMKYMYPYLGHTGTKPFMGMWDPRLPMPDYARVLVVEK